MMIRNKINGRVGEYLKLALVLMLALSLVRSEFTTLDIKDPGGNLRVNDLIISTTSADPCGNEGNQNQGTTCDYELSFSECDQEGYWKATATTITRYCSGSTSCANGGSNICSNSFCSGVVNKYCCQISESSSETTIYNINWDGDSSDCSCIGGTWLASQCCGDDGNADDYENAGAGNSCCIDGTVVTHGNSKDGLTCTDGTIGGTRGGCDSDQHVTGISSTGEFSCANDPARITAINVGSGLTSSGTTAITVALGSSIALSSITVEGEIQYTGSGTGTILYGYTTESGLPNGDGFRIRYNTDEFGSGQDALVIEKTDNGASVNGGIAFANRGPSGVDTALLIHGNGDVGIEYKLYDISDGTVNFAASDRLVVDNDVYVYGRDIYGTNGWVTIADGWKDQNWAYQHWSRNAFGSNTNSDGYCTSALYGAMRWVLRCVGNNVAQVELQACTREIGGSVYWWDNAGWYAPVTDYYC